jgi:hypothetical protein
MDPKSELHGFNPQDFFWVSATAEMAAIDCPAALLAVSDADCTKSANAKACYDRELCKNKAYSEWLANAQMTHTGADARYEDSRISHNAQIMTTINLGIGIAGLVLVMYS